MLLDHYHPTIPIFPNQLSLRLLPFQPYTFFYSMTVILKPISDIYLASGVSIFLHIKEVSEEVCINDYSMSSIKSERRNRTLRVLSDTQIHLDGGVNSKHRLVCFLRLVLTKEKLRAGRRKQSIQQGVYHPSSQQQILITYCFV